MDVCMYQPVIDWVELKEYFAAVIARSSLGAIGPNYGGFIDKEFQLNHVVKAYDNDVPILAYHVLDPGYYVYKLESLGYLQDADNHLPEAKDEQWQTFLKAITNKQLYGIAVDFEMCKDWNGKIMPSVWLLEVANRFMTLMKRWAERVHPGENFPILFYSGSWFINSYVPELINTQKLNKFGDVWTAFYPYAAGVVALASGDDLKANYPPENLTFDGGTHQNPPFLGWPKWTIWQYSGDKFTLPWVTGGISPSALDLNFFNGTKEQLYAYLKFAPSGPVTPPDPDDPPVTDDADLKEIRDRLLSVETQINAIVAKLAIIKEDL
jgi:hypothetical protein